MPHRRIYPYPNLPLAADRFGFFLHALPPDVPALTLPQFHELITDLWLTRHDAAIQHEEATRRKGRPRSAREVALRELKLRDEDEYKSGLGMCVALLYEYVN